MSIIEQPQLPKMMLTELGSALLPYQHSSEQKESLLATKRIVSRQTHFQPIGGVIAYNDICFVLSPFHNDKVSRVNVLDLAASL